MPFVAKCPYCRQRVRVPDRAMAESLRCPGCQSWYTAMVDMDPAPEPQRQAGEHSSPVAVAPAPVRQVPFELSTPLVPPPEPAVPESTERKRVTVLGVLACLLAAGSLLTAASAATADYTRGLAIAGFVLGLVALFITRPALPAAGAVVSALVLVVSALAPALLGPKFEASRQRSDFDPNAVRIISLKPGSHQSLEQDGWVDASLAAVQQGLVRVEIIGATIGPVQVVDSKKRSTRQHHLVVSVRVRHLGHGPEFRFVHWGSVGERTAPAAEAWFGGIVLPEAQLAPDVPVGLTFSQELFPGSAVDDLLIFAAPLGRGPVRISLPAEAWGGRDAFRFHIPESMIVLAAGAKGRLP